MNNRIMKYQNQIIPLLHIVFPAIRIIPSESLHRYIQLPWYVFLNHEPHTNQVLESLIYKWKLVFFGVNYV